MTAANTGASTPEDDDPFGYLYEDGRAAGATPPGQSRGYGYPGPAAQPGVPRTSYNQVRTVGERQYGQQVPQQQQSYAQQGQPTAQYAAPETYPGGAPTRPVPPQAGGHGGGRSGGPNTKGLLIGAIAVVAVVVIGIAAALITSGGEDDKAGGQSGGNGGTSAGQSVKPSDEPSTSKDPQEPLPKQDAATLKLGGTATVEKTIKGAEGADGVYVTGFNQPGSSVTWKASMKTAGA